LSRRSSFGKKGIDKARVLSIVRNIVDGNDPNIAVLKYTAEELFVSTAFILKMFGDLDSIHDALTYQILTEIDDLLTETIANRAGRDALEAYANILRAYAQAHPTLFCIALRPARRASAEWTMASRRYVATRERLLASYGLPQTTAAEVASCLGAALEGFINAEISGRGASHLEFDRVFERLVDMLDETVTGAVTAIPRSPQLVSYG